MPDPKTDHDAGVADAAERIRNALDARFERRARMARAVVTSVQRDAGGRAIGVVATIDGVASQTIQIDHGGSYSINDVLEVQNRGADAMPRWHYVRRVRAASTVPTDDNPTLPAPTALSLQHGLYSWAMTGGVRLAWIYAGWHTIEDAFGKMSYQVQIRTNDLSLPPTTKTVSDPRITSALPVNIDDTTTVIPREPDPDHQTAGYDFAYSGRVRIGSEKIDYTTVRDNQGESGTGTGSSGQLVDSGKSWDTAEWTDYALVDSAGTIFLITDNNATTLFVTGTPASGAYSIHPAFSGCTRGVGSTSAASHLASTRIVPLSFGTFINELQPNLNYNVRVRAYRNDQAYSAWTSWSTQTTSDDTTAPPTPTGFQVKDQVMGVLLQWSGPNRTSCKDLAGFKIYRADAADGTGSELVATIGVRTYFFVPHAGTGWRRYYAISAVDYAQNESAKTAWTLGITLPGEGVNVLSNSDFERATTTIASPPVGYTVQDWSFLQGGSSTFNWAQGYGRTGGRAVKWDIANNDDVYYHWPWFSTGFDVLTVPARDGDVWSGSIYFQTTVPQEDMILNYEQGATPPGAGDGLWFVGGAARFWLYDNGSGGWNFDDTAFANNSNIDQYLEALPDNWYRLHVTVKLDDLESSYPTASPLASFSLKITNLTGSQVTVYADRAQLELGGRCTEWKSSTGGLGGSLSGSSVRLLIDTAGIDTADGQFRLGADGKMHSDVTPGTTGKNLGAVGEEWDTLYAINVVATNISATGSGGDHGLLTGLGDDDHTQYLLADGSRNLTGSLAVSAGVTIDGVDISVHAADQDAHHSKQHSIIDSAHHTIPGASNLDVVGMIGGALGLLTPSYDPGAAAAILRTDATGLLALYNLEHRDTDDTVWFEFDTSGDFKTGTYTPGYVGSRLTKDGDAELNNASIRGSFYSSVFVVGSVSAQNASALIADAGRLHEAFYVPVADPPTDPCPSAKFTQDKTSGEAPLSVTFTDQTVGTVTSWLYEFSDGTISTSQNPVKSFNEDGTLYDVKLTVEGPGGTSVYLREGLIETDPPEPIPPTGRVTSGLEILYDFDDNAGTTISDNSGVGTDYDLTIGDSGAVAWGTNCLLVKEATKLYNSGAASKAITDPMTNDAITVEAWIKPTSLTQADARMATLSGARDVTNFVMAQNEDVYAMRVRTDDDLDNDGLPNLETAAETAVGTLTHVMWTRAADETETWYINGQAQVTDTSRTGDFSTWATTYGLTLSNEVTGDLPWLGLWVLFAIYDRALSAAEALQNYNAGPGSYEEPEVNPIPPPPVWTWSVPKQPKNATHYVSPSGSDAYTGTAPTHQSGDIGPWKTIKEANRNLTKGDVLAIRGGSYEDYIEPENSGTEASPIVYMPYQGETVIIEGKSTLGRLCRIGAADYIQVFGLNFKYAHGKVDGADWPWVEILPGSVGTAFVGNTVIREGDPSWLFDHGYKEFGIQVSGAEKTIVANNTVKGMKVGIKIKNKAKQTVVYNNEVSGITFHPLSFGQGGEIIQGTLVLNNLFEYAWREDGCQAVNPDNQADPDTSTVTRGVVIRGNIFRHCGENALDIKSCRYWTIENNVFYDAKGSGDGPLFGWNRNVFSTITRGSRTACHDIIIRRNLFIDTCPATRFFAGDGAKAKGIHIYNNTIMGCNRDYTGYNSEGDVDSGNISKLMVGHRMQGGSLAERCTFANNIVGGQNTAEIALRILNTTGQYYNYNWYWNTRGETFVSLTNDNKDWSRKTFTQWKSLLGAQANIRGAEAQSTSGTNPRFINGPERPNYETKLSDSQVRRVTDVFDHLDYRLRSSSPAINQGGPIAYATNAGDQSDALKVDDATRFCDGYGITEGDKIRIGNSDLVVEVTAINYSTNTLTLSESEDWEIGHAVHLDYNGDAPDPGWMETDYA